MYGIAINSLILEAKTDNTGSWTSIFSRNEDQGNKWNTTDINLSAYVGNNNVQLRLYVVTGSGTNGWQSDFAIDAISIQTGSSNPNPV